LRISIDQLIAGRRTVRLLEEEPLLLLPRHARERPAPPELVAEELHLELAPAELLQQILGLRRAVPPAVPHDDRAGAVVAGSDHPFEVRVLDGVVLHVHGQALLLGVHGRTLGHGPALEDTVHLEAQVVVEAPRGMLLDHEHPAAPGTAPAERLRCPLRVALLPVRLELRCPLLDHNPWPLSTPPTTIRVRRPRESWSIAGPVLPCQLSQILTVWRVPTMPPHSLGSGTISFGLVSIPVKLYTAASAGGVSFNQLHAKCGNRLRQQMFTPDPVAMLHKRSRPSCNGPR